MNEPLTTSQPCQVHNKHIPNPHLNERHHVWPLGEGGPDIPENIVVVCPTGHFNIHALLKLFKLHAGPPPYTELRQFTHGERNVAELGYVRLARGAM